MKGHVHHLVQDHILPQNLGHDHHPAVQADLHVLDHDLLCLVAHEQDHILFQDQDHGLNSVLIPVLVQEAELNLQDPDQGLELTLDSEEGLIQGKEFALLDQEVAHVLLLLRITDTQPTKLYHTLLGIVTAHLTTILPTSMYPHLLLICQM